MINPKKIKCKKAKNSSRGYKRYRRMAAATEIRTAHPLLFVSALFPFIKMDPQAMMGSKFALFDPSAFLHVCISASLSRVPITKSKISKNIKKYQNKSYINTRMQTHVLYRVLAADGTYIWQISITIY